MKFLTLLAKILIIAAPFLLLGGSAIVSFVMDSWVPFGIVFTIMMMFMMVVGVISLYFILKGPDEK